MATNAVMILNKLARNLEILGLTVASQGYITQTNQPGSPVQPIMTVTGDSTTYTVTYLPAAFSPTMIGGVDPTVSPFLGIGTGNPGQLCLQSAAGTTAANTIAGPVGLQLLCSMASFANDIVIANNTTLGNPVAGPSSPGTDQLARIRGQSDLLNVGQ